MANAQPTRRQRETGAARPGRGAPASVIAPGGGPACIAVYAERHSPPRIVHVPLTVDADGGVRGVIDELAGRAFRLAREQGGRLSLEIVRELVENLIHASFEGVVITILDKGNTLRVSDRGPGIPDKQTALKAGFTSADAAVRELIRGVGSGLAVVREAVGAMGGSLEIEDNLGGGTVVTVCIDPPPDGGFAPRAVPSYNLSERQLKALLLTIELAPVGPSRVAHELGVSTSTAYRDLVALEKAELVASRSDGRRTVTDAGLAYLDALL